MMSAFSSIDDLEDSLFAQRSQKKTVWSCYF